MRLVWAQSSCRRRKHGLDPSLRSYVAIKRYKAHAAHAQFKSHYLASPRRREKVAFAQAFHAHAEKSLAAQQAAEAQTEAAAEVALRRKGQSWFSAWRGFSAWRPVWPWGAAVAALALLVGGSWLMFGRVRPRPQVALTQTQRDATRQREQESQQESENKQTDSAPTAEESTRGERERLAQERTQREQQRADGQPHAAEQQRAASQRQSAAGTSRIASFVLAPQMRGAGQTRTISIPPQTAYVAVRLNLEPNEFSTYRVALLDAAAGQTLWRSSRLKARADRQRSGSQPQFPRPTAQAADSLRAARQRRRSRNS